MNRRPIAPQGYSLAKQLLIRSLETGQYQHEERGDINVKNKLAMGEISAQEVIDLAKCSDGTMHSFAPHHTVKSVRVHIIKVRGWYLKFYFVDPQTIFISVHLKSGA